MTAVLDTTIRIIADKAGIEPETIKPDTSLIDLDIQSLDLAAFMSNSTSRST